MDTKEAIEFCETEKRIECGVATQCKLAKDFNKVIALLKRGEKYEAMWLTLLEDLDFMPNKEKLFMDWKDFNDLMIKIEQKFFPKEAKKDIETSGHFFVDQYFKEKEAKQDYPEGEK